MSINIRFLVYNAYGIGGTVKTIFNFANYLFATGKYNVEIISIKITKDVPTLFIDPSIKITAIQDARKNAQFSESDKLLLSMKSRFIDSEEDLYPMFNGYTDKGLLEIFQNMHDGVLVTTIPSFNALAANMVDNKVLKIGQEHKSYADHTKSIQKLICENYGKLDAITILTERNKEIYNRKLQGQVPIYVLGNGTELVNYRANLKNHIIVAAGRYVPQKGYDMLIRAFGKIKDRFPDWLIKIYGEGQLADDYIKIIQECNVERQIILAPGTDKLNEKLSEAAIHICSSYCEAFGMVIIEGFAMGIPCISFECDGPVEIITDGYDGILVPREDIDALAEAMARLMSDEELRMELGKNAYETAKKYDIKVIGENFRKIVEKGIQDKSAQSKIAERKETTKTKLELQASFEPTRLMVESAIKGQVGFRTIIKMFAGWVKFKVGIKQK